MKKHIKGVVDIEVFVTKTHKFRAKIKEVGKPAYQITIGGKRWKQGEIRPYNHIILNLILDELRALSGELKKIIGGAL